MTQKPPDSQLTMALNTGQGPDGKVWGVLVFASGPVSTQIAIPPDALAQIAKQLPAQMEELAAAVRRANMGLVIKTNLNGVKP